MWALTSQYENQYNASISGVTGMVGISSRLPADCLHHRATDLVGIQRSVISVRSQLEELQCAD
jgi:hypothetical protein